MVGDKFFAVSMDRSSRNISSKHLILDPFTSNLQQENSVTNRKGRRVKDSDLSPGTRDLLKSIEFINKQ
jgi:hypothetical protein